VLAVERLCRTLGLPLTLHPRRGELAVYVDGTPFPEIVCATSLGVDLGKVLAVATIVDQVSGGAPSLKAVRRIDVAAHRD
jgi:hypothetical protein